MIVTLLRKPLTGTIIQTLTAFQGGGMNIDACRNEYESNARHLRGGSYAVRNNRSAIWGQSLDGATNPNFGGRYPMNVLLGMDSVLDLFPNSFSGTEKYGISRGGKGVFFGMPLSPSVPGRISSGVGSASRFFKQVRP